MVIWEDLTVEDKLDFLKGAATDETVIKINLGDGVSHVGVVQSITCETRVQVLTFDRREVLCWVTDIHSVELSLEKAKQKK